MHSLTGEAMCSFANCHWCTQLVQPQTTCDDASSIWSWSTTAGSLTTATHCCCPAARRAFMLPGLPQAVVAAEYPLGQHWRATRVRVGLGFADADGSGDLTLTRPNTLAFRRSAFAMRRLGIEVSSQELYLLVGCIYRGSGGVVLVVGTHRADLAGAQSS
jgi:hypothetical protein